jgi:hypothetical protein
MQKMLCSQKYMVLNCVSSEERVCGKKEEGDLINWTTEETIRLSGWNAYCAG